jgi:hypothetical protein
VTLISIRLLSCPRPLQQVAGLVAAIFLTALGHVEAAVIKAVSVSLRDVTPAVASASTGDTVVIPAGTATWAGGLRIKKAITLQGSGIGSTVIKDGIQNGTTRLISFTLVSNKASRMTGIEFQDGGRPTRPNNGELGVLGSNIDVRTMRIDHCKFNGLKGNIQLNTVVGVADHNEIITSSTGFFTIWDSYWNGATTIYGDKSWASPLTFGGPDFFFIEDNTYTGTASVSRTLTDGYAGARFVVRHNVITDGKIANHGTDSSGRIRSGLAMEIYNNTFHQTSTAKGNYIGGIRGGVVIYHDNTCDGFGASVYALDIFRVFMGSWGGATGRNLWDINVAGGPFYSGTASAASSGLTVTVSGGPGWTTNQWAGYAVNRTTNLGGVTDHGFSEIVSNTANTMTYKGAGGEGNNLSVASGDSLQIWKVSQAMDMPGVSGGQLVTIRGSLSPLPSPPPGWNDQVVTPCYSWNNTRESGVHVNFTPSTKVVVLGTHYFNDTAMPGYTPYTYPHPLTTSPFPSPAATTRASLRKPWGKKQKKTKEGKRKPWKKKAKENPTNDMSEDQANLGE